MAKQRRIGLGTHCGYRLTYTKGCRCDACRANRAAEFLADKKNEKHERDVAKGRHKSRPGVDPLNIPRGFDNNATDHF